jgi:hypothetical protein
MLPASRSPLGHAIRHAENGACDMEAAVFRRQVEGRLPLHPVELVVLIGINDRCDEPPQVARLGPPVVYASRQAEGGRLWRPPAGQAPALPAPLDRLVDEENGGAEDDEGEGKPTT